MPEILYPSQTPLEKPLTLPAEGYVQRQEKMSSQDLAYLQKEVQEQWKPAAAIVLVLAIVITVMQLSQNEELIIPQIIMALFGTLVIIAAFSNHYKLQRDLREGKKECTLGLVQHKRLLRKIGLRQTISIGKTWLFFSIFISPFYTAAFFVAGDLEDVGLLWQNTKPWVGIYWIAALGLLYFLIQKSLKTIKEDLRHGEKNQRFIVFSDKQKAAGNLSIKALLIPSPQSSGKSKMLFVIDQDGQHYELQDASLFEQIQVGKAYQLTYLPESRHWISLREASGQELYSF